MVPCLIDGKRGICDLTDFGQEVAHYVDRHYRLNLFPKDLDGLQLILSCYIENDLESVGFKVNDTYVIPTAPSSNGRCSFATRSGSSEEDAFRNGPLTDGICVLSLWDS